MKTCKQIIYSPEGVSELCNRPCEYHYSKALRLAFLESDKYQGQREYCPGHTTLRSRWPEEDSLNYIKHVCRPIGKMKGWKT